MHQTQQPADMTEEERFQEVAAILAAGVCRLKARAGYLDVLTSEDDVPGVRLSRGVVSILATDGRKLG